MERSNSGHIRPRGQHSSEMRPSRIGRRDGAEVEAVGRVSGSVRPWRMWRLSRINTLV